MTGRFVLLLLLACCFDPAAAWAQKQFTDYKKLGGSIQVGPMEDVTIPLTERGYTLLLPEDERRLNGLVVVFSGRRQTLGTLAEPMKMHGQAFEQGLGLLYVSTGNPVDFYFEHERMLIVRDLIRKAVKTHKLPLERPLTNLSYVGFSIAGTQALKFTIFCQKHPETCGITPKAVAVVDAPLDMTRFWRATERAERVDFHPRGAGEGRWVSHWLEKNLGGTPHDNRQAYVAYSPYTYTWERVGDDLGGNARHLKSIPVRTYAEPDVNWHIEHRQRSYYSMNATDMAALVTDLNIMGNDEAAFIATHDRRTNPEENTHSWSIVDEADLMRWFASKTRRN